MQKSYINMDRRKNLCDGHKQDVWFISGKYIYHDFVSPFKEFHLFRSNYSIFVWLIYSKKSAAKL